MASKRLEQVISEKIFSFEKLPDGWHYGSGIGSTTEAVVTALEVGILLIDYKARNVEVFPDINGGIMVAGYRDQETVDVHCMPDGALELTYEVNDELKYADNRASIDRIENYLGGLEWLPKRSSAFCTQSISAQSADASSARHFSRPLATGEFRCSRYDVPWKEAAQSVDILIASTGEWLDIPVSSGESVLISFPGAVASHPRFLRPATPATGISVGCRVINVREW